MKTKPVVALSRCVVLPMIAWGSAGSAHAILVITEAGDFLSTPADTTRSENIGVLTDHVVQISGVIHSTADIADAWTFTVPAGAMLTGINVTASGFDGKSDFIDLYSDLNADPELIAGDLLTASLTVANHPLAIGPGTYKFSAASIESQGYTVQILSVPEPSAFLYGGLVAALAGCGYWVKRRYA